MKKITKRLCVAVSVLSVAAGSMAVNVPIVAPAGITWAADSQSVNVNGVEWKYSVSSDKSLCAVALKNTYGELPAQVTVPSEVNGIKVTAVAAYAFAYCSNIESVVIPDSVTIIGSSAFRGCTDLKSVELSENVKEIQQYAFEECSNLEEISLGNEIEKIGKYAFYGCNSLESVTIPQKVTVIDE